MDTARTDRELVPARLGLFDAVSLIVGIIIGVGIFETPARVFRQAPDPFWGLAVWAIAGVIALLGALCFAELASAYPRSGGEYVYLTRAYGSWMGYLFAWAQLGVIRTGNMAILAFLFAIFAGRLWGLDGEIRLLLAVGAMVVLTAVNLLGVTLGKGVQNCLTVLKVVGLLAIVTAGFLWAQPAAAEPLAGAGAPSWLASALIMVFFAYGGWNEAAYVAAEVKNTRRNVPIALILGTAIVAAIYLLINGAVVFGLGFREARADTAVEKVVELAPVPGGGVFLNVLAMISALSGLNGMIFTTARITAELGTDHPLLAPLGRWSRRFGTPARALIVQAIISLLMVLVVGLAVRANVVTDAFDAMLYYTAGVFWLFFLLTGVALFVLRQRDPSVVRPFKVPGYPVVPAIFCLACAFMIYGAIDEHQREALTGLAILAAGVPLLLLPKLWKPRAMPATPADPPMSLPGGEATNQNCRQLSA